MSNEEEPPHFSNILAILSGPLPAVLNILLAFQIIFIVANILLEVTSSLSRYVWPRPLFFLDRPLPATVTIAHTQNNTIAPPLSRRDHPAEVRLEFCLQMVVCGYLLILTMLRRTWQYRKLLVVFGIILFMTFNKARVREQTSHPATDLTRIEQSKGNDWEFGPEKLWANASPSSHSTKAGVIVLFLVLWQIVVWKMLWDIRTLFLDSLI